MDKYILKVHANGQYWKIVNRFTCKEYSKDKAVELVNELDMMLEDREMELDELESENRRYYQILHDEETQKVWEDFMDLERNIAIYEYLAENDIDYWYFRAKSDCYDQYLISKCKQYDIELNPPLSEGDSTQEMIYDMENQLRGRFRKILKIGGDDGVC